MRLDLKTFHGPEGRQVPRRPERWMLPNSESELELDEWNYPKPVDLE